MAGNIEVWDSQKFPLPNKFPNRRLIRKESLLQKPTPSFSISPDSTENVEQIVDEAVKRIGGIEKVTPETLLDELMSYEGLNLLDVDRHIQTLKRLTNLKGNKIWKERKGKLSPTMNKESSELKVGSRALMKDKIMDKIKDMELSKDEVANVLEAEENMWHFCTLFPQDYEFEKDTLIQQWIALGFLKGEHKDHLGDLYFSTLLDNDYIMNTRTWSPVEKEKYKVNTEKMKDDASTMSYKELYLTLNSLHYHTPINKEAQYVSLVGDGIDKENLKKLTDFKDLKTLMLLSENGSSISKVPHNVFLALKHLEVLNLSRTSLIELPSSIGELIELKYLDLSNTLIELLPETLDCLSKLQTLKLKDCRNLSQLPDKMRKLISLKHLELDVLEQLAFMPRGMGALTELETLPAFLVHKDDGRSIKELKNMNNLKGSFCISKLENVSSPLHADEAEISMKKCITQLELRWSDLHQPWNNPQDQVINVLNNLRPNSNLEQLQILCYGGIGFPSWIGDPLLNKLTNVTLFKCDNAEALPALGKLPALKYLSLLEMSSVTEIGIKFRGYNTIIAFPKLERLAIVGFSKLKRWKDIEKWDYPCLSRLTIERCPELDVVPSLKRLNSLNHLEIINCGKLNFSIEKILSDSIMTLIIEGCPSITEWLRKRKSKKNLHKIQHVQNLWIDHELVIGN